MTFKEFIGMILRLSPLWSIPISITFSIIAANEATKKGFPKKTVISCASYALFVGVLVLCWYLTR